MSPGGAQDSLPPPLPGLMLILPLSPVVAPPATFREPFGLDRRLMSSELGVGRWTVGVERFLLVKSEFHFAFGFTHAPAPRERRAASTRDTRPLVIDQSTGPAHAHQ